MTTNSRDQRIVEWQKKCIELAKLKDEEMALRKQLVAECFVDPKEGVNTLELGAGYQLKFDKKFNYNVDSKNVEKVLEEIAKYNSTVAESLVSWKASLRIGEYRELNDKFKRIFDSVLTITEAAPSLELKEPKVKK